MHKNVKIALLILLLLSTAAGIGFYIATHDIAVLNPKGLIALKQRQLLYISSLLMLIVVVPVMVLTLVFAWKYREGHKGPYTPEWDKSHIAEILWWGIPCLIIVALSVVTWRSTHELNPFRPIESDRKPLVIQVVALQWKWLFIYPEQGIATVNVVQFPANVPIHFEITADAPMNSFWIPALGGQIYAMPAMKTQLHLMASEVGTFRGSSANISGTGFAGMTFQAHASSDADFEAWVKQGKRNSQALDYEDLIKPSQYNEAAMYTLKDRGLFHNIIMKYMK